MISDKIYNKTCDIKTPSLDETTNADGTIAVTYSIDSEDNKCALQKLSGDMAEAEHGLDIETTHILLLEDGVAISDGDRVVVDSLTYKVISVEDAAGRGHHQECELKYLEAV